MQTARTRTAREKSESSSSSNEARPSALLAFVRMYSRRPEHDPKAQPRRRLALCGSVLCSGCTGLCPIVAFNLILNGHALAFARASFRNIYNNNLSKPSFLLEYGRFCIKRL